MKSATEFFGRTYREATRRPGQARRVGMTDEEEAGRRMKFECAECGSETVIKLPKNLALAEDDGEDEGEDEARAGRLIQARCGKCGESYGVEAPRGMKYVSRTAEASSAFSRRYQAAVRESTTRHGHLTAAMQAR